MAGKKTLVMVTFMFGEAFPCCCFFYIYIYIYIQLLSCVFFFSPNFGPVYFVAPATTLVMLGLEGAVSVNLFILYHNGLSFVIA